MRDWPVIVGIFGLVFLAFTFAAGAISIISGSAFVLNFVRVAVIYVICLVIWFIRDRVRAGLDQP